VVKRRWQDLSPRSRRVIPLVGAVEGTLKTAALVDLRRRPAHQVRGPKRLWALAIVLTNTAGVVPLAYFLRGRREAGRRV
jgi:hypothetical protein